MSRGRFIARLDQDDLAERARLARTVDGLRRPTPTSASSTRGTCAGSRTDTRIVRTPPATDTSLRIALLFNNVVCHSALAFRADVLTGLDEWYRDLPGPQDYDLIVRVLERTRSHCIPEPLAVYRQSTMAMTSQYSDRMDGAVEEISARQLARIHRRRPHRRRRGGSSTCRRARTTGSIVRDVRAVLAGAGASDPRIDARGAGTSPSLRGRPGQCARRSRRRGGLPNSPRFVAELVRGDVRGAAAGVFARPSGDVASSRGVSSARPIVDRSSDADVGYSPALLRPLRPVLAGNSQAAVDVLDLMVQVWDREAILVIAPPHGPKHAWQPSLADHAASARSARAHPH